LNGGEHFLEDYMDKWKNPTEPWQRDCVVNAVETIELRGERVPLSFSQLIVEDRQITTSLRYQVAWGRCRQGRMAKLTRDELGQAISTAQTLRQLQPKDLMEGDLPWNFFSLFKTVFRCIAECDSLVVMHDPDRDLPILIRAVEGWMGIDLPPVSVVSVAALERARHLGLNQNHGETPAAFYQRIKAVDGALPNLMRCYREQEWTDGVMRPTDRLFPAFATCMMYQHHFGGRLLRDDPAGAIPAR